MTVYRVLPQPAHLPFRGGPYDDQQHAENYLAVQRWLDRAYVDIPATPSAGGLPPHATVHGEVAALADQSDANPLTLYPIDSYVQSPGLDGIASLQTKTIGASTNKVLTITNSTAGTLTYDFLVTLNSLVNLNNATDTDATAAPGVMSGLVAGVYDGTFPTSSVNGHAQESWNDGTFLRVALDDSELSDFYMTIVHSLHCIIEPAGTVIIRPWFYAGMGHASSWEYWLDITQQEAATTRTV